MVKSKVVAGDIGSIILFWCHAGQAVPTAISSSAGSKTSIKNSNNLLSTAFIAGPFLTPHCNNMTPSTGNFGA
uniref:Uncharacterized protein n=1 Tax=Romanomermis culicivorax TaxID=13658 RepID=A0A915JTG0_ROMCU